MAPTIITLTTDFGLRDPYVAEMKAVILGICPNATIVDISHEIEKFNVKMGAFILASAAPYFPKGTIHVAVVDPGVGTKRKPILIETEQCFYIGPDNGVLALAATKQCIKHIYEIANSKLMLPKISNTFHGRDVFAPAAAHLANGTSPADFGPQTHDIAIPEFAKVVIKQNSLIGEVLHIDGFGNIITNFSKEDFEKLGDKEVVEVRLKNVDLRLKVCKAYSEVEPQKPLAIIGSHNFLEISVNQGNAAKTFKAKIGDKIVLRRVK
ncbi:MAG: SAM-dependent chlorinase/fluorinase [Candidatus Bathyarchaeia archaeon]